MLNCLKARVRPVRIDGDLFWMCSFPGSKYTYYGSEP